MGKMSGSANETGISPHDPRATNPKAQWALPRPSRLQAMRRILRFYKSRRPAMPANSLRREIQRYDPFNRIYLRETISANIKAKLSGSPPARLLFSGLKSAALY
jgi:hypothetical protein